MWSWLPDELLQRIVQLVAEHAPRALAIFALLDQRSRALAAARLACMKSLLTAPFSLTVQSIFSGSGRLDLSGQALHSVHMELLAAALISGALASCQELNLNSNHIGDIGISALAEALGKGALDHLTVCWRPTALLPCLETLHTHSTDSDVVFDVQYAGAHALLKPDWRRGDHRSCHRSWERGAPSS
jgi:hypothetical protein